jgi:Ca2+-binding RTX toxin-like protein
MAITAFFIPSASLLSTLGDNLSNTVTINRDAAGRLLVNGGAVGILGGTPTVANTTQIQVFGLGGNDALTLNEASGALPRANLFGGTGDDAAADTVVVDGTAGGDVIDVVGAGSSVAVLGLAARVNVTGSEGANDSLVVNAGAGNDAITATTLPAGVVRLTLDGGAGNDVLLGSQGADLFLGGEGDDFVFGDNGNDTALLGAGDDIFQWDPGDGNDVVEGQDGFDQLLFNGANVAETIDVSANGGRALFTRSIANVTMDLNDVEEIAFNALGGGDAITVGDLSGTDVARVSLNLGGNDGQVDTVTVNATGADDVVVVTREADGVRILGLSAEVFIFGFEATDRLVINGLAGDDVLLGSPGLDVLNGGTGDNILIRGSRPGRSVIRGGGEPKPWITPERRRAGAPARGRLPPCVQGRLRVTRRPGFAPLMPRDAVKVETPLSHTSSMPIEGTLGFSKVAASITVAGSKTTMSA